MPGRRSVWRRLWGSATRPGQTHPGPLGVRHPGDPRHCSRCPQPPKPKRRKRAATGPVELSRASWRAIVSAFRAEGKILEDSYGVGDCKSETWREQYKAKHPIEYQRWVRAERAIASAHDAERTRPVVAAARVLRKTFDKLGKSMGSGEALLKARKDLVRLFRAMDKASKA